MRSFVKLLYPLAEGYFCNISFCSLNRERQVLLLQIVLKLSTNPYLLRVVLSGTLPWNSGKPNKVSEKSDQVGGAQTCVWATSLAIIRFF